MTVKYFEGVRWGNITLKKIETRKKIEPGGSGVEPYWGGDFHHQEWTLVCDCGHEWVIESRKFPGRSQLRSCGREECSTLPKRSSEVHKPIRGAGRPPLDGERRRLVPVNMPVSMHEKVMSYAADQGISASRAFVLFIASGIAYIVSDDDAADATITAPAPMPIKRSKPWKNEAL